MFSGLYESIRQPPVAPFITIRLAYVKVWSVRWSGGSWLRGSAGRRECEFPEGEGWGGDGPVALPAALRAAVALRRVGSVASPDGSSSSAIVGVDGGARARLRAVRCGGGRGRRPVRQAVDRNRPHPEHLLGGGRHAERPAVPGAAAQRTRPGAAAAGAPGPAQPPLAAVSRPLADGADRVRSGRLGGGGRRVRGAVAGRVAGQVHPQPGGHGREEALLLQHRLHVLQVPDGRQPRVQSAQEPALPLQ